MVLAVLVGGQGVYRGTNALFVTLIGGIGKLGDDPVHDPMRPKDHHADSLPFGDLRRPSGRAVEDGGCPLRWKRRQPGVLGRDHAVGRQKGEGAPTSALPEQQVPLLPREQVAGDEVGVEPHVR